MGRLIQKSASKNSGRGDEAFAVLIDGRRGVAVGALFHYATAKVRTTVRRYQAVVEPQ